MKFVYWQKQFSYCFLILKCFLIFFLDSEVVQNCTHEVGNEYKQFYLKLLGVKGNFSCQIVGKILGMEILQTHLTGIRISSNGILLYG